MAKLIIGENDLGTVNPQLAAQWHPTKNGTKTQRDVTASSRYKAHWKCAESHEWEASIAQRSTGTACPYCAGQRVLIGFNDLGTINPRLAAEWHPTKNEILTPQNVTAGSTKKVWWRCREGHDWDATIASRSKGRGCPTCAGQCVLIGFNDLGTVNPDLSSEWHPTKNGELTPQNFTLNSGHKPYWICSEGHEWEAKIASRSNGNGCPTCKWVPATGVNDLGTTNPELIAEWHPTKNGELTPQNVTAGSNRRVHWKCSSDHEWEATISHRSRGRGCRKCWAAPAIRKNNLSTTNPELVPEWHPVKNGDLTPQHFSAGSNHMPYWICTRGHEWKAKIADRSNGSGCRMCSLTPVIGVNDLGTTHPDLVLEWHPTKNGALTPRHVHSGSVRRVHWQCLSGHEWEVGIAYRARGTRCPDCYSTAVGLTEQRFRDAFGQFSKHNFESIRIPLIRLSRKFSRAQIDMLNDELNLAIEYDGEWTHGENSPDGKGLEKKLAEDKETTQALVDIGYNVIRIREHSTKNILPFVPLDAGYASNVYQIIYKSFGSDKDGIDTLTRKIIEEKADWFKYQVG